MTISTRSLGTLPQRLFADWHRLCLRPELLERARSWPVDIEVIASLDDLLRHCGYEGRRDDDTADEMLRQVVEVARHDDLAARVVLQRLLPGLLAIAHRRGHTAPGGSEPVLAELVGVAWELVRSYPVQRRPRHVAANLVRDTEYQAFRRPSRLVRALREIPVARPVSDQSLLIDPTDSWLNDPGRQLGEVLRSGRAAGLATDDLELLARLAAGEPMNALASDLGVSDRTLRTRRALAVERLRRVVAAA
jgi:hypothetical protein